MISITQVYKFGSVVAAHLCLLTIFQPMTIILFWVSVLLILHYLKLRVKRAFQDGLIVYLPQKVQQGLMERSIFDLLCDFWFMPGDNNLLKVFIKPFFTKIKPQQAASMLNELNPQVRRKILTKGIVNILPNNVQGIIVSSEKRVELHKKQSLPVFSSSMRDLQLLSPIKSKENAVKESTSDTINNRDKGKKFKMAMTKEFQDQCSISVEEEIDTTAIKEQKVEEHHQWDRLELYAKNIKDRWKSGESVLDIMKSNLGFVKTVFELKNITRISTYKVGKLFLVMFVLLVIQLKLTKQNSKLIVNVVRITLGITTSLGLLGSTGILLYKIINSNKQRRSSEQRALEEH